MNEQNSDTLLEARRKYNREYMRWYRRKNPDKIREINERYWRKKELENKKTKEE